MKVKNQEIELFNRKLLITERTAHDVLIASSSVNVDRMFDATSNIYLMSKMVEAGLRYNVTIRKWFNPVKWLLKYKLNQNYLSKHLSIRELSDFVKVINALENIDDDNSDKKKVPTVTA